jgi:hypothetical protein
LNSPAQRTAWQFRQSCAQRRRDGDDDDEDDDPQAVEHAVAIECAAFSGGVVPGCDMPQGESLVALFAAPVREWIAAAPGRVHLVILEELRARPAAVLSALCHFMGLQTVWSDDGKAREVRGFSSGGSSQVEHGSAGRLTWCSGRWTQAVAAMQPQQQELQQPHDSLRTHPLFTHEAAEVAAIADELALSSAGQYARQWSV